MALNVSSFFVAKGIISETDLDVYVYSFEVLFSSLYSIVALIILAFISATVINTALFMLGFIPLRQVAGGFHAKNHFRCFIILMFSYAAFLAIIFFLPDNYVIYSIILSVLFAVGLVFLLAPSENSNKPFTSDEKTKFKKKSRFASVCYTILIVSIVIFVSDKRYALSLVLGNLSVGISLLANFVRCNQAQNKQACVQERREIK